MPSLIHVGHWSLASLLQPSVSHCLPASVLAMPSPAGGVEQPASICSLRMRGCGAVTLRSSVQSTETFLKNKTHYLRKSTEP